MSNLCGDASRLHQQEAKRALRYMQALLASYRESCGEAPYLYAVGEVGRLERELADQCAPDELVRVTERITWQVYGLALAIRKAKGRGLELDA